MFNLAVRVLGLIFVYLTVRTLADILYAPGVPVILTAAIYAGAAWWLTGGAHSLIARAYPEKEADPKVGLSSSSAANV